MSKGSKPRPMSISREEFARRWDMAFGKVEKEEEPLAQLHRKLERSVVRVIQAAYASKQLRK